MSALAEGIRWYKHNGKQFMSVTSILKVIAKPELVKWAAREAVKAKDKDAATNIATAAASRGTRLHAWIEARLKGTTPQDVRPEEEGYRHGWLAVERKFKPELLSSEETVVNEAERYAGTLDATYRLAGVPTLMDYKSVNGADKLRYPPYREHRLQLEAYRRAKYAMTGVWVPQVAVARFAPDGQYAVSMWRLDETPNRDACQEAERAWTAFKDARDLLEWLIQTDGDKGDSYTTGYYNESLAAEDKP